MAIKRFDDILDTITRSDDVSVIKRFDDIDDLIDRYDEEVSD